MTASVFKDHFSSQSDAYACYRPGYPQALFGWLTGQAPANNRCWDCATGSGQAAHSLANYFSQVIATDASAAQIASALPSEHIDFRVATAENSSLPPASVDLITVAQALHWFHIPGFFQEVERVLKPGGLLAILSYNLLQVDSAVDKVIAILYHEVLTDYWPAERRLIESGYAEIDLPYPLLQTPSFAMQTEWELMQLTGYLNTWSAVKRYADATGKSPLAEVETALHTAWGDPSYRRRVSWPLSLRVAVKPGGVA